MTKKFIKMEYFPGISNIKYEGSASLNDLSFKWYNADQVVLGKVLNSDLL